MKFDVVSLWSTVTLWNIFEYTLNLQSFNHDYPEWSDKEKELDFVSLVSHL